MDVRQLEEPGLQGPARVKRGCLRPRMCRRRCLCWGLYVLAIAWLRLPMILPMRLRTALMAATLYSWGTVRRGICRRVRGF